MGSDEKHVRINGEPKKKPFLIGVSGGTASGKVGKFYVVIKNRSEKK